MAHIVSILQNDTNFDVTVLWGTRELRQSYKSPKSLKLNSGGHTIVYENLSSLSKNFHQRRSENLTIEEELNEINASSSSQQPLGKQQTKQLYLERMCNNNGSLSKPDQQCPS